MKVEQRRIKIREIVGDNNDFFIEDTTTGAVKAMKDQKLDIRPEYQREFVYKEKQQQAVINSILNGFPLNTMYFVDRQDGSYEVLDGQQRILSICHFLNGNFACLIPSKTSVGLFNTLNYNNLPKEKREQILDYELEVYVCNGTDEERMDWFQTINIAGATLTRQEILNAIYHGKWLNKCKETITKHNSSVMRKYGKYFNGKRERQDWLETVFEWKADDEKCADIPTYMGNHRDDDTCNLFEYVERVFKWVEKVFGDYQKEMKGIDWGILYNKHKNDTLDPQTVQDEVKKLMMDYDVSDKKGIYTYVLTRDEKHLHIRDFNESDKRAKYEDQKHICPHCKKEFEFDEMQGDHIKPWSLGGHSDRDNLQMLCKKCNQKKSNSFTG